MVELRSIVQRALPFALAAALFGTCQVTAAASDREGTLGVNKFDLLLQYLGMASGGDGDAAYRRVTEAMARKAIADAADAGIRYFRVSATGYMPTERSRRGDLDLWRSDRSAYWMTVDRMMADLERANIRIIPSFVWNPRQFPAMNGESVRDLVTNADSRSYRMLEDYVSEFVARYRERDLVLFYELGNELNLYADLDMHGRCAARWGRTHCESEGNYSTDEMIGFTGRLAARIRRLDPSRPISSGHSFPRPAAQHLRRKPEFAPGGPDWTSDSRRELSEYVAETHDGLEIISVHIYEAPPVPAISGRDAVGLIAWSQGIAQGLGKKLFVGEFGGQSSSALDAARFLPRALEALRSEKVPYSALWVWQYYQSSTYRSFDSEATRFNIEPGYSDALIRRISTLNRTQSPLRRPREDITPPNVLISWPLQCARSDREFEVHVLASDDSGSPPHVVLEIGARRHDLGRSPPYESVVDVGGEGEQLLTVTAEDAAGNRSAWQTAVVAGGVESAACRLCCD